MGRLQPSDIVSLRRSYAATRSLTPDHIEQLLDEVERLQAVEIECRAALDELAEPWSEVRHAMARLHRTITQRTVD